MYAYSPRISRDEAAKTRQDDTAWCIGGTTKWGHLSFLISPLNFEVQHDLGSHSSPTKTRELTGVVPRLLAGRTMAAGGVIYPPPPNTHTRLYLGNQE